MSRLVVAVFAANIFLASTVAQPSTTEDGVAASIERVRKLVAVDEEGCVKYPQNTEIVVCGENPDNKSQRIFRDRGAPDENRIRTGEAVSATKAASCIGDYPKCSHRLQKIIGVPFGYVPPPAIPLEEVLKGLPEPDMIVTSDEPK
jgi:hypothetical protein